MSSQPAENSSQTPPKTAEDQPLMLDQTSIRLLLSVLHKAEKVLDSAYEVYHGDAEQVTHKFLLKRLADTNEQQEKVLQELSALDGKVNDLEARSKQFASTVSAKLRELKPE